MGIDKVIKSNKILLFLCGGVALIVGIVLILLWWRDIVSLFKAVGALALALGGLVLLDMVKDLKD